MKIYINININVSCDIIYSRVPMAHHAELKLGIRRSVCTLESIVLLRHNPRNFVSDKLPVNLFPYCNLPFISWAFFVLKWKKLFSSKFSKNKFTLNQPFNYSSTTFILSWQSTIFESVASTLLYQRKISVKRPGLVL